jgi:hypothetical protein
VKPLYHNWNSETDNAHNGQQSIRRVQKGNTKKGTIQLVPPDNHRQNLAESAIQTFKNHFKAILAGVDDTFQCNSGIDSYHKQSSP